MKLDAITALQSLYHNESDQVVYLTNGEVITNQEFRCLVNSVSSFLSNIDEPLVAIHTNNTHHAAALVLGAWQVKKIPVLLPNNLPAIVNNFVKNHDALFCNDDTVEQLPDQPSIRQKPLATDDVQLAFFTSGSTGKPVLYYKNIQQLLVEVEELEHTFETKLGENCIFCSGVSHQHIYGFLFKLLWPLLTQRQVLSPCYHELIELPATNRNLCWITSPAQLKRLQAGPDNQLAISCVFSSGSPLDYDHALMCKELFDVYPFEIYGSTETGGIAFRQQTGPNRSYTAFKNVDIKTNESGLLEIKSPYLADTNWFEVQDKVELTSARTFNLLGRADRIVKIEGKRISLTEIEGYLAESELCQEAFSLQLNRPNRQIVAVAIALSETGRTFMANHGRRATITQLNQCLSHVVDPIMMPKRWRFLANIPRNAQHKIDTIEIETYFDSPTYNTDPSIVSIEESELSTSYQIFVARDLAYFHGHFPQLPILPGVVQIGWVLNLLYANHAVTEIRDLKNLKFNKPILPGTYLELVLEHKKEKHSFRFSYTNEQTSFSSGELLYTLTD